MVVGMKVYLDLIFIINFMFDLLLLMTVSIECKIIISKKRIILGALFGSLTTFLLFLPLTNLILFLFKVFISIIMVLISFKIKSKALFLRIIKSLYGNSIILGGLLTFLNNQLSYFNNNLLFIHNKTTLNIILIIISSPIIFTLYHKTMKKEKFKQKYLHKVEISYLNKTFITTAYLDSGNNVKDPYQKRSIIITTKDLALPLEKTLYVPYKALGINGLLKCIEIKEIRVDNTLLKHKYLLGTFKDTIDMLGSECILPNSVEEELN
mgnify:FL=1